ncbi:MAG: T9SS C-terminal target domain-containing protein [Bacteroidetes bacterium]|nr:MAG: T9SS C-terminal target domain-containing protein [Bacteroidota bacterium]
MSRLFVLLLLGLGLSGTVQAQPFTVKYRYDAQGRLTRAGYSGTAFPAPLATDYRFDPAGHLVGIDTGEDTGVAIDTGSPDLPDRFALHANYPNPFNPRTTIRYDVREAVHVRLTVYDLMGRQVATLVDGPQAPGRRQVTFEAGRLASGVYFYRIEMGRFEAVRSMTLLR